MKVSHELKSLQDILFDENRITLNVKKIPVYTAWKRNQTVICWLPKWNVLN